MDDNEEDVAENPDIQNSENQELSVRWQDKIMNEDFKERPGQASVDRQILQRKWSWI